MMQFQNNKKNFTQTRLIEAERLALKAGEVELKVNSFSFTANNITYAAMGDQLGYWQFFPVADDNTNEWGIIPVWGFATVTQSNCDQVHLGERYFGYFPPADFVTAKPDKVSAVGFMDGADHRSALPAGYNIYRRVPDTSVENSVEEHERSLLYPLYLTSFILHDYLSDNDWFAADQIIIGAASSKTSIGLAYALAQDPNAPDCIAITSQRNLKDVRDLELYDQCFQYDSMESMSPEAIRKSVIVDMSANSSMLTSLNQMLGDDLKRCIAVGLTHWHSATADSGIPKDRREMFFAPSQIQKRIKQWGPEAFEQKSSQFISDTAEQSRSWLKLKHLTGLDALAKNFDDVAKGRIDSKQGLIITL